MIHRLELQHLALNADSNNRIRPGTPARLWLSSSLADLAALWPRTREPKNARSYAFQCADVLEIRCNTIAVARSSHPLFIAVLDADENPLIFLPLSIERHPGARVLSFLDGGLSDYNCPVVFPLAQNWTATDVDAVWRGLLRVLPAFDVAVLDKMPEWVGDLRNPLITLAPSVSSMSSHVATLTGTWHDFESKRLPHRRTLRNLRRRLKERGSVTFEIARTSEDSDIFLEALIRQKIAAHTIPAFRLAGYRSFVTEMTRQLRPSSTVHLSALKVGDEIIAAHWGYVVGPLFHFLLPSHEGGTFARYSPGRLLLEDLLQWAFANGIKKFDFGIGDENYKYEYCDLHIPLHVAVMPITWRGSAYSLGLKAVAEIKDRLRNTIVGDVLKSIVRNPALHGQKPQATGRQMSAALERPFQEFNSSDDECM